MIYARSAERLCSNADNERYITSSNSNSLGSSIKLKPPRVTECPLPLHYSGSLQEQVNQLGAVLKQNATQGFRASVVHS